MTSFLQRFAATAIGLATLFAVASIASASGASESTAADPDVTISPGTLRSATVGVLYGETITVDGPQAPYTVRVTQGSLPPGLSLSSGGALRGTPSTAGTFTFTISAYANSGPHAAARDYAIVVAPPPSISPSSFSDATVGVAYAQTVTVSGSNPPYTVRVTQGALPPGLALTAAGALSGTPTASGAFAFTIGAYDSAGAFATSRGYNIDVAAPPAPAPLPTSILPTSLPAATAGTAYSQTIEASGPRPPYTVRVTQGALPPGLTLSGAGALSGTPTSAGSYSFTVSSFDAAGAYTTYRDYALSVAAAPAPAPPSPTTSILPTSFPGATVAIAYAQTVTVSGPSPPYTVRVTQGALPPGLTLTPLGVLAGVPLTTGTYAFTISAFNLLGMYSGYRDYSITVTSLTPIALPWLTDDFELGIKAPWWASGDSSQFGQVPGFSGQGIRLTNYPTSGGPNASSQMAALWLGGAVNLVHASQGEDTWYRFRVFFPADYQATTGQWNWVAEWHNDNTTMNVCGLSAVSIGLAVYTDWPVVSNTYGKNPRLALRLAGGNCSAMQQRSFELPSNSLQRGHWYDMLFHFVWSTSSTAGLAEWWVDGQQQVSTSFPTLYTRPDGTAAVNSFGFYHYRLVANWTSSIHYDNARIGPSRTSVG